MNTYTQIHPYINTYTSRNTRKQAHSLIKHTHTFSYMHEYIHTDTYIHKCIHIQRYTNSYCAAQYLHTLVVWKKSCLYATENLHSLLCVVPERKSLWISGISSGVNADMRKQVKSQTLASKLAFGDRSFCCSGIGNPFPGGGPSPPQADELELWARGEALLWTHHIRAARVTGCLAYTGVPNKMLYLYQYLFFRQWKEPWLMVILRKSTAIICMIVAISISTKANVALFL